MADYLHPYKKSLGTSGMQQNAIWLRNYLQPRGWSMQAIAACLGNWESECTLNPNRPQRNGFPDQTGGGFGIAQWTPWGKKYGSWCKAQGIGLAANDNNPAGRFEPQIEYHDYECRYGVNGGKTWYASHGYSYSWDQFKRATDNPATMAVAYYWQYERSAAGDPGTRPNQALAWYNYLTGQSYSPIPSTVYNRPFLGTSSRIGNIKLLYLFLLILLLGGGRRK